jgi:ubiquinone/menaquinone biosynthesis C-methylase UbiE
VALLLARLVGALGEVVGIERDPRSISRARTRIEEARVNNVQFIESDVAQVRSDKLFDAAVGRYILMFLPDPASVLRSLSQLVRPGGVLVFQEASYSSFLAAARPLPLWSAGALLLEGSFGVAVRIRKWHPIFPAYSEMRVCQRHLCVLISCEVQRNGW